jgi:TonB family protein
MLPRFSVLVFALGSPALAVPPPPPPAIEQMPAGVPRQPHVLTWQASQVTCGKGAVIAPALLVAPDPQPLITRLANTPDVVTVHFAIDADGRAVDMTAAVEPRFRMQLRDFMPALRASRFAVTAPQTGCTIRYTPQTQSVAEAPLETLAQFGVAQRLRVGKEVWDRIAPGDCRDRPRLAPLSRSYPDFRKLTRREGARHWTYVSYDIDSDGVPVNLATPFTTGDAALDAEARAAVAAGRYAGGPRKGCVQAWWSGAGKIPAPPIPPKQDTQGNPACEIKDRWEREPRLVFPPSYQQRAIEGWAILRYDVAPWGEIGAIEVLDAQPGSEFGEAAVGVIRNARFKPLETGLKGCVDRVIFRIRPKEDGNEDPGTAEPA